MRFPNALGLARARGKGGVVFEGDGEITLPPVSQPVGEFSSPVEVLPTLFPVAANVFLNNTFFASNTFFIAGVTSAGSLDFGPFNAGTWLLRLKLVMQTLTMTQSLTRNSSVQLIDPDAGAVALWRVGFASNLYLTQAVDFEVTFPRSGFLIRQTQDAGLVTETASFFLGLQAFKIL